MRKFPLWATCAMAICLPVAAHASLWRMDGLAAVDGFPPSTNPDELLTAQIDDAALAGGLNIRLVCFERACDINNGPNEAFSFGAGLASSINPLVPDFVVQRHVTIGLGLAPDGLAGEISLSDDGPTTNLDLNIASQLDGSWAGTFEINDGPVWTLSAARWTMIDPVDPTSVPEPSSAHTFLAGLLGAAICLRRALTL